MRLVPGMRLVIWMIALAAVVLAVWGVWGEGMERGFSLAGTVAWLEKQDSFAWLMGWGLLVSDVILPVPGTVVMSALGWVYGWWLGGLLAAAGSFCAGSAAYGLCRLLGERGARFLLGEKDLERGRKWFESGGGLLVAVSRSLPILPEIVACTAGLVGMPWRRFAPALACGCLPMGFIFAAIGAAGREAPSGALAASLVLPALLWWVARLAGKRLDGKA